VTGWWAATPWIQTGIVAMGTNALLGYGRNITKNVKPLAPSGVLVGLDRILDGVEALVRRRG
jgi:hypothetical protein